MPMLPNSHVIVDRRIVRGHVKGRTFGECRQRDQFTKYTEIERRNPEVKRDSRQYAEDL